jgi:hypothetical protein
LLMADVDAVKITEADADRLIKRRDIY